MGPKRPNKRRPEDQESSRQAKKPGKNKRDVTYDTYDDAMDGGVEMEEKGERYRDGDKAQRFYEKALDLYKKAYEFEPTYDAAYNQARVLYTLATSFMLPPISLSYVSTAIGLYKHAITLTENTLLQLDAGYNLALALLEMAEVLEDIHVDGSRRDTTRTLREDAREMLQGVLAGQEEYVAAHSEDLEMDQASEAVSETGKDESKAEESMELETEQANEDDKNEGEDGAEGDEGSTTYETHVPTPSSLIDTALQIVDLHLSLWASPEPASPPTQEEQNAVRNILDNAARVAPPGRVAQVDLAEIKVLLAMDEIVWDIHKGEAKVNSGIEKSLEGAIAALSSLLASLDIHPPDEPTLRAEILSILADTHLTTAYRLLYLAPQLPPGPSPLAQAAWYNFGQVVTHLTTALELPTNPDTPKTFKPNVLLTLSKASLARASLSAVNETAKRNVGQLVDNATNYATKAAQAIGWGGFLESSTGGTTAPPYPAGWDTELLAKSIILQQLRTGFAVSMTDIVPDAREKYKKSSSELVERLKKLPEDRQFNVNDVQRFVQEIREEEEIISELEVRWWAEIASQFEVAAGREAVAPIVQPSI